MGKRQVQGKSDDRTPAKHEVLHALLMQEMSVLPRLRGIRRAVIADLTAGNGRVNPGEEWHLHCSPGIIAHAVASSAMPTAASLSEAAPQQFRLLKESCQHHLELEPLQFKLKSDTEDSVTWIKEDDSGKKVFRIQIANGLETSVSSLKSSDAVFINNDPNAITDWAMRPGLLQEIIVRQGVRLCRTMSTMGCNPHGLKRIPFAVTNAEWQRQRVQWFAHIESLRRDMPVYHDLLLSWIEKDSHQWAYAINTSRKPKWKRDTESVVERAFTRHGMIIGREWWRSERKAFNNSILRLFLTKEEMITISGREDEFWECGRDMSRKDARLKRIGMLGGSA